MKIYVGDIVKNEVDKAKKRIKVSALAKRVGLSRTQLYVVLQQPEMELKYIKKLGKALEVDFTATIKNLKAEDLALVPDDSEEEDEVVGERSWKDDMLDLQGKYISALEEILRLKNENKELERKLREKK